MPRYGAHFGLGRFKMRFFGVGLDETFLEVSHSHHDLFVWVGLDYRTIELLARDGFL